MLLFGKIIKKIFYLMEIMKQIILNLINYLKRLGYTFKNQAMNWVVMLILYNKKISLANGCWSTPDKKFSSNYQAGSLSFEIYLMEKN